MPNPAVEIQHVWKRFTGHVAVRDLSLTVPRGSVYGLLGPNGAGKTTTIRMLLNVIAPDEGTIHIFGELHSKAGITDRVGYLPEERGLYRKMQVRRVLRFLAQLKGMSSADADRRIDEWLERLGLNTTEKDWGAAKVDELSRGMQQKVQFISTLIHDPDLVILDEPFSGLDPVNMRLLRELVVEQHARGATILFSTHVMPQAEQICEHIVMIHEGRKVLDESLGAVRARYDPKTVLLEPLDAATDVRALASVTGVEAIDTTERGYAIRLGSGADVSAVLGRIVAVAPPRHLELERPSLEDVFIELVGKKLE